MLSNIFELISNVHIMISFEQKMRLPGLEPGPNRWQRLILPLDHRRWKVIVKIFIN